VLSAGSLKGRFASISVDGFSNTSASYSGTALTLTLAK
jgi:hypothetical protein